MVKALFLANDPGGYEAVFPIYNELRNSCQMLLLGSSGERNTKFKPQKNYLDEVASFFYANRNGILVTGTSWNDESEITAIKQCKECGIKTVSILDYWSNYKARFRMGESFVFPDYLFVMDGMAREEAVLDGIDEGIIHITGNPMFDKYFIKKENRGSNGRALFLSQPISEICGNNMGYTEFSATEDVIRACRYKNIPLDVKFHPKESVRYKEKFQQFAVDGDFDNLVCEYSLIIGMCTMGLLQCALLRCHTISYQPNLKGLDLCITNRLGLTRGAYTYNQLVERIEDDEENKSDENSKWLWMDGNSTERCCKLLERIYDEKI